MTEALDFKDLSKDKQTEILNHSLDEVEAFTKAMFADARICVDNPENFEAINGIVGACLSACSLYIASKKGSVNFPNEYSAKCKEANEKALKIYADHTSALSQRP